MRRFSLTASPDAPGAVLHVRRLAGRNGRRAGGRRRHEPGRRRPGVALVPTTTGLRSRPSRSALSWCRGAPPRCSAAPHASRRIRRPGAVTRADGRNHRTGLPGSARTLRRLGPHRNETFGLMWDPNRLLGDYAAVRRAVPERCRRRQRQLQLAVRGHAAVHGHRPAAGNASMFAGGYRLREQPRYDNGYTCQFGANHPSGAGNDYPANGCPQSGNNVWTGQPNSLSAPPPTTSALPTPRSRASSSHAAEMGRPGGSVRIQPVALAGLRAAAPPGVEVCLDAAGYVLGQQRFRPRQHTKPSSAATTLRSTWTGPSSTTWSSRGRRSGDRAPGATTPPRRHSA